MLVDWTGSISIISGSVLIRFISPGSVFLMLNWISLHPFHIVIWIQGLGFEPETGQFVDCWSQCVFFSNSNFQAISAAEVLKPLFTNWTPVRFSFEPNWIGIQKTYSRNLIQQLIRRSPGPVKRIQELQRTGSITWVWISRSRSF